jgi:acetamidase/formamidase
LGDLFSAGDGHAAQGHDELDQMAIETGLRGRFQFFVRKDKLTNPDDKALNEGKVCNFSFAVHDDNITTRGHHVSFPVTVGFGVKAAIEATKLK